MATAPLSPHAQTNLTGELAHKNHMHQAETVISYMVTLTLPLQIFAKTTPY